MFIYHLRLHAYAVLCPVGPVPVAQRFSVWEGRTQKHSYRDG
jgi:hypothetical protein